MKFRFRYYENRTAMGFCIGFFIFKVLFTIISPLYGYISLWMLSLQLPSTDGITNGFPLPVILFCAFICILFVSIFFVLLVINRRISNFASLVLLIISIADLVFNFLFAIEFSIFIYGVWPLLFQSLSIVPLVILRHSKTDFYL